MSVPNGDRGVARASEYDAIIVGASLAGTTAATLLARSGARVALVERRPDPNAFKRVCGHYIMPSAVPTLERLGLLPEIERAGGVRSPMTIWTRWGYIRQDPARTPAAVNLRRERLDPIARRMAAEQDGVDLMLGQTVRRVLRDGTRVTGVEATDKAGRARMLRGRLTIGADGRDSAVARLAGIRAHAHEHGRFAYAGYYEGPPPAGSPGGTVWFLDPNWAAAFPTDSGLTAYACMPTKDRLPEFRRDPAGALTRYVAGLPDAPPILASRRVGPVIGKVDMPNVRRGPVADGLALVGDAALATDPLWGVGCGWALQSGEWLADAAAPALAGEEPLERALRRYRRTFRRHLGGHAFMIDNYASGRRLDPFERTLYSAAASDQRVADRMIAFGTRCAGPQRVLNPATAALVVRAQAKRLARNRRSRMDTPALTAPAAR